MEYQLASQEVIIVAVTVWFAGTFITNRVPLLKRYSIPVAVTGGLLFSIVVAVIRGVFDLTVSLNLELRDLLLLTFFTTIGLSARFRVLLDGGKALVILLIAATILLCLQNLVGILSAQAFGAHPAYGLFGGSVSLAGGDRKSVV